MFQKHKGYKPAEDSVYFWREKGDIKCNLNVGYSQVGGCTEEISVGLFCFKLLCRVFTLLMYDVYLKTKNLKTNKLSSGALKPWGYQQVNKKEEHYAADNTRSQLSCPKSMVT